MRLSPTLDINHAWCGFWLNGEYAVPLHALIYVFVRMPLPIWIDGEMFGLKSLPAFDLGAIGRASVIEIKGVVRSNIDYPVRSRLGAEWLNGRSRCRRQCCCWRGDRSSRWIGRRRMTRRLLWFRRTTARTRTRIWIIRKVCCLVCWKSCAQASPKCSSNYQEHECKHDPEYTSWKPAYSIGCWCCGLLGNVRWCFFGCCLIVRRLIGHIIRMNLLRRHRRRPHF